MMPGWKMAQMLGAQDWLNVGGGLLTGMGIIFILLFVVSDEERPLVSRRLMMIMVVLVELVVWRRKMSSRR